VQSNLAGSPADQQAR